MEEKWHFLKASTRKWSQFVIVNDHPELIEKSPLELFELFFDQEMF